VIVPVRGGEDVETARTLFLEYAQGLGVDLSFQGFAQELKDLPGAYAPPGGALLLAVEAGATLGCVAVRAWDDETAEMKRLYLRPAARGRGLGVVLAKAAVEEARRIGYRKLRLDTLPGMEAAQAIYQEMGFREIPPYRTNPVPGARYLELKL
jgi:ribosomal protein S18 acetylase RimI-like enzyme